MKQHTISLANFSCTITMRRPEDAFLLPAFAENRPCLWVTDERIWRELSRPGSRFFEASAFLRNGSEPAASLIVLESGETGKTWAQVASIIERGFSLGLARDGCIVGLGGGVVCDMAAFAASVYMRGCRLALIPTTLLAQVDAALGGKTGINFGGYKNMVGTFYPASELRIVPEFCESLSDREYRSGLAEVLKHGLLEGGGLLELIESRRDEILGRDPVLLADLVWQSLMVKARVVEEDLYEKSIRAHLNLGHTFAHGLESAAGFGAWTHGEAVAWGMLKAALLSHRLGLCDSGYVDRVRALLSDYAYRLKAEGVPTDRIVSAMLLDKKKKDGSVRFVLQKRPGETLTMPVDEAWIRAVLEAD